MNFDNLDKITLSDDEVDMLFEWRDNHKEYVRNYKPVLTKGLIQLHDKKGNYYHYQMFEDDGVNTIYNVFHDDLNGNLKLVHSLAIHKTTKRGKQLFTMLDKTGVNMDMEQYNMSIVSIHASLMAYMEYYSDKKEYVEIHSETVVKNKKPKKKNKSKSKKVVKIRRKVYKIKIDQKATVREKQRYERHMDKWTVKGHWRTTKLGKRVWVKPHIKGTGKEVQGKEYRL